MKPLLVLVTTFLIGSLVFKLLSGSWHTTVTGNYALSIMLFFTAIGHFRFTKGMALMLPTVVPLKKTIIYITGLLEVILGIGFLYPEYRLVCGAIFIGFLILALPANIRSAFMNVNYETANYDGKGPQYLWFRIPMQLFLLLWVFYFAMRDHFPACFQYEIG